MEYLSIRFALLVFVTVLAYYTMGKLLPKKQWTILLIGSMLFYASYKLAFLIFLFCSILTTYGTAWFLKGKQSDKNKKWMFIICIIFNLGMLAFTKYCVSFTDWIHVDLPKGFQVIVPLGIAYYSLQVIAYLVDVYKGKTEMEKNIFKYALFISYFPIIVQGPIERKNTLYRTLFKPHTFDYDRTCRALQLILWGLMKKMVIADRLNITVSEIFSLLDSQHGFILYLGIIMYTIQIYMDFSGCVDICRGVSRLFRVEISRNFNNPYFATTIKDFWHKWHITLSGWLRDYVYIPLGGNRKGTVLKYVFLMITFFVSGLWHGDGLKFVVWGLLHGAYQVIGDVTYPLRKKFNERIGLAQNKKSHKLLQMVITFHLVAFAWIFFRCETFQDSLTFIGNMFRELNVWVFFDESMAAFGQTMPELWFVFVLCLIVFVCEFNSRSKKTSLLMRVSKQTLIIRWSVYIGILVIIATFGIYGPGYDAAQFIYGGF